MALAERKTPRSVDQKRAPGPLTFDKDAKAISQRKDTFSTNGRP